MRYDDPNFHTHAFPVSSHLPLGVVDYICSHGYTREMIVLVETALMTAGEDEDKFIRAMALQNHPGAEAGFIWRLAQGRHCL